jgi:Ca2+-binding EF-hand superfamily protein
MYDKTITEEEAAQMIFQANPKSKDRIDFDEFFNMIISKHTHTPHPLSPSF